MGGHFDDRSTALHREYLCRTGRYIWQTRGVEAVGLLLADNHGGLNVIAASGEQARLLELFQLQNAEGP
jgi:hypothetical protein